MAQGTYDTDTILTENAHLIHSFADLFGVKQDGGPTVIAEAKGAYVRNSEGDEFLDGIGGLWCVNVGHGRQEIIDAMKLIWKRMKIVMEPSSAVPLATILKNKEIFEGKRVGVIITGGNVDLDHLPWN